MLRRLLLLAPLLTLLPASPAGANPCDLCGTTTCSGAGEVCLEGIPDTNPNGRCLTPCPNPGAAFGGCPQHYTCVPLTDGSRVCIPRSSDCTNVTNYVERQLGETCTTESCASGLICFGICTRECTGFPNQGSCPSGMVCGRFGVTNPIDICGYQVNEGDSCSGSAPACTVGLCLDTGSGSVCYRDCAASTCATNQTCQTYNLNGGGMVSVCEPPGAVAPPADSDSDGIVDSSDNCPSTWNPDQSDIDRDGQGDTCDPDDDGDFVNDSSDNCPLISNANQQDSDFDGIGDACDGVGPSDGGIPDFGFPPGFDAGLPPGFDGGGVGADARTSTRTGGGGSGGSPRRSSGCRCVAGESMDERAPAAMLAAVAWLGLAVTRRRRR